MAREPVSAGLPRFALEGEIDMKYALRFLLMVALVSWVPAFAQDNDHASGNHNQGLNSSDENEKALNRLNQAAEDLNKLVNAPDNGIPQTILADAKCVAIVPSMIKGGFIFGAEHGRGVATCRTEKGWSAPAFFTATGGNWGAQVGVEGIDLVMLFMNREGAEKLLSAKWKIGAAASIAAGPYGRDVAAGTSWKANTAVLTYSRAKGAFIGADLTGVNIHADENAIKAVYGHPADFREILTGKVPAPPETHHFLAQVHTDFHEANASK